MGDIIIIMIYEHHLADMEVVSLLASTSLTYVAVSLFFPWFLLPFGL
jgi:hypothetical protein